MVSKAIDFSIRTNVLRCLWEHHDPSVGGPDLFKVVSLDDIVRSASHTEAGGGLAIRGYPLLPEYTGDHELRALSRHAYARFLLPISPSNYREHAHQG